MNATAACCAPGCCNGNPPACSLQNRCAADCITAAHCGLAATTTCLGCPPNTYGSVSAAGWNCTACAANELCPGLLAAPIFDFAAAGPPAAAAAACPLLATLPATPRAGAVQSRAAAGYVWLVGIPTVDGVILAGLVLAAAIVALFVYSATTGAGAISDALKKFDLNNEPLAVAMDASGVLYVKCYATKVPLKVRPNGSIMLATGDSFIHPAVEGAEDKVKRPQGGAVALLSLVLVLTLALVIVLQRDADNTLSVLAANFLRPSDAAFAQTLPFYASPSWGAGVQVRLTAAGANGACSTLVGWQARKTTVTGTSNVTSAWSYSAVPDCGGTGVAQHVFRCESCAFTASSALVVGLDWACQALYVEAGAIDAGGVVSTDLVDSNSTRAKKFEMLLSSVVEEKLYLNLVNDTYGSTSVRGYALAAGASSPAKYSPAVLTTDSSAGLAYYFPALAERNATVLAACPQGRICAGKWDPSVAPNITLTLNVPLETLFTVR